MSGDGKSAMETIGHITGSCDNYLDCEETASQNLWEIFGRGWEEVVFFSSLVFGKVEERDQRFETERCDWSRKKSRWMFARRPRVSTPFCDWVVLLHQAKVKTECTPERLQREKRKRTKDEYTGKYFEMNYRAEGVKWRGNTVTLERTRG